MAAKNELSFLCPFRVYPHNLLTSKTGSLGQRTRLLHFMLGRIYLTPSYDGHFFRIVLTGLTGFRFLIVLGMDGWRKFTVIIIEFCWHWCVPPYWWKLWHLSRCLDRSISHRQNPSLKLRWTMMAFNAWKRSRFLLGVQGNLAKKQIVIFWCHP